MSPGPDQPSDAIEAWVRRHQVRAWRYLRLRGCPAHQADDLVQEALLAALHKQQHLQDDERAAAWLRGALENLWRMHLRSEGRRARHTEAALAARALARLGPTDDGSNWLQALQNCLQRLEGRSRRLLDLHYRARQSRQAIAAELGLRENGVKAMLRRVRTVLRDCVARHLEPGTEPSR